jgi:hypothetical protein
MKKLIPNFSCNGKISIFKVKMLKCKGLKLNDAFATEKLNFFKNMVYEEFYVEFRKHFLQIPTGKNSAFKPFCANFNSCDTFC